LRVYSKIIEVKTYGPMVLHNITNLVRKVVDLSNVEMGLAWLSVEGATPALIILRNGEEKTFLDSLTKLIPFTGWRHGNAYAHLISTILSTNIAIPIINKALLINSDENIYLLETRSVYNHTRRVLVQIHENEKP